MAEFCKKYHDELFGEDVKNDIVGLCKKGEMASILCEGCGENHWVDHKGKRIEFQNTGIKKWKKIN